MVTSGGTRAGMATNSRLGSNQLPCKPEEWFLKVVIGLGGDIVVLKILLAMEDDGFGLDLPVLDVYLIPSQHNGNVLTHSDQISVPVWNILVGHSGGHVKHYDGTLTLDVYLIPSQHNGNKVDI